MKRVEIGNLPTPIQKLEKLSEKLSRNIYIKRDDFTGIEVSGNKVRKLEYVLGYAMEKGFNTIITVGALQSNHCRATAAVCAKYNLKCHLVLKEAPFQTPEGNMFFDILLGAKLHRLSESEFENVDDYILKLKEELDNGGNKALTVPVGASNEIGSLGYVNAMEEIFYQEKKLGVEFDLIALTVGSGGTYAGSIYGVNKYFKMNKDVLGFAVADNKEIFKEKIKGILQKMYKESNEESLDYNKIMLNDDYVGEGYGKPYDEELKFIKYLAKKEGIILDPVYTGKAFYGLCNMIKSGKLKDYKNILFIHTGGIFGWSEQMRNKILKEDF